MPRRPSANDPAISGFPEDGDPYDPDDQIESVDDNSPAPAPAPTPDPLAELKVKLDRQAEELAELRRRQAPPQPKDPAPAPRDEDEDTNWDEELFRNPKATLEKHAQMVEDRVTKKLTSQYQRDRGTQKFWDDFYEVNPDLKGDHDLVEVTLNSNLAEMASMPVVKAMERLAELTRDRILRYAGGAAKARPPKARVEGGKAVSNPPQPPKEASPKILSLTEIIKDRRALRRKKAVGV